MLKILRQYEENGYQVTEYTRDGVTVSTTIKQPIPVDLPEPEPIEPTEPQPTPEDMQTQTLLNTEYLVIMSELTNL